MNELSSFSFWLQNSGALLNQFALKLFHVVLQPSLLKETKGKNSIQMYAQMQVSELIMQTPLY